MTAPVSGRGIAASALRSAERRLEVVANNLANVSTNGFKAGRSFSQLLGAGQRAPVITSRADERPGDFRETGAPLDLAVDAEGYTVVRTPRGEHGAITLPPTPSNSLSSPMAPSSPTASCSIVASRTTDPAIAPPPFSNPCVERLGPPADLVP